MPVPSWRKWRGPCTSTGRGPSRGPTSICCGKLAADIPVCQRIEVGGLTNMKLWMPLAAVLALAVVAGADDIGKKVTDPVSKKQITVAKDQPYVYVFLDKVYF